MAESINPPAESLWRRTFALDLGRAVPQGCVDTVVTTFAVFIAERYFSSSAAVKVFLIASPSAGMLASLLLVQWVRRLGWSVNRVTGIVWTGAACAFALSAIMWNSQAAFVAGVGSALFFLSFGSPLISQIYQNHYPNRMRGRLFSISGMARGFAAAGFGIAAGGMLNRDITNLSWLLGAYAFGCLLMAVLMAGMAPVRLESAKRVRLFDAFSHVRLDAPFRKLLVSWMLFGMGNLLCLALFVEYLANPRYGYEYDAVRVGWVTTTIPMLAFLSSVVAWGILFDRLNFYLIRVVINVAFIVGIMLFYFGGGYLAICIAMVIHGAARAGGHVAWSLWVTKFASAERVAEYMSVHTFLTGVRGLFAPVIAFTIAGTLGPQVMALFGVVLILLASIMIVPDIRLAAASRESYAVAKRPRM